MIFEKCACGEIIHPTDPDALVETAKGEYRIMCRACREAWQTETDDDDYNSPVRGQAKDINRERP